MSTGLLIKGLLAAYREGRTKPVDVLRNAYERASSSEQPVWIELSSWEEICAYLDAAPTDAALYGIPFAVKDNIDLAGVPTTAACPAYAYTPPESAFVVQRLLDAGAIPFGKTNMDQFATGLVGTRTPHGACASVIDARYISGGSSSGSAVAVASGMVSFSLGTDTAGSGRVPAAFNEILGLKPTRGLLSMSGVIPACRSLDCVSIFASDAADAQLVFDVAAVPDPADAYSISRGPAARLRGAAPLLGLPSSDDLDFFGDGFAQEAWRDIGVRLRRSGWQTIEVDIRPLLEAARLLYEGSYVAERFAAVGDFVSEHADEVDLTVAKIISGAVRFSAVDAFKDSYRTADLIRQAEPIWRETDALLLPTAPTIYTHEEIAADPIGHNTTLGTYTNFVNLMGLSAVAIPGVRRSDRLPFGVSLIAPGGSDDLLLQLAAHWQALNAHDADVTLAVVGAHLIGQPLNHQLVAAGGRLLGETTTAPAYRLYDLGDGRPGLIADHAGAAIAVELWKLDHRGLGQLLSGVSAPLGIGTVTVADGEQVKGFLCEPHAVPSALEITGFGGWRAYLAR